MKHNKTLKASWLGLLFALILSACGTNIGDTPVSTVAAPSALPPTPTTQPQTPSEQGFVVYDRTQGKFIAYAFDGSPLNFEVTAPNVVVYSDLVQVVEDAIYFRDENNIIVRADAQGPRALNAISSDKLSGFKVSPDETQIAWSLDLFDQSPARSELWIANVDGSAAHQVAATTSVDNREFVVLRPYRWSDGKLLYTGIPTGIGGYILYSAWNSVSVYDPVADQSTPLYKPDTDFEVCVSGVAVDLSHVAFGCSIEGAGKVSLFIPANHAMIPVPDLPEQGQAGNATFSRDGAWLAYAIARGDPENERGQGLVVPVDLSSAPLSIASQEGGVFNVIDWIDDEALLLFLAQGDQGSVWRVNRDGSNLTQLATGDYVVGLMR